MGKWEDYCDLLEIEEDFSEEDNQQWATQKFQEISHAYSDEDDDYDYDDDDMYDFFSSHFSFNIFEQMFGARFRGFRHGGPGYVYFGRDYGGTVPKSTDQIGEDYERRMANVVHCAALRWDWDWGNLKNNRVDTSQGEAHARYHNWCWGCIAKDWQCTVCPHCYNFWPEDPNRPSTSGRRSCQQCIEKRRLKDEREQKEAEASFQELLREEEQKKAKQKAVRDKQRLAQEKRKQQLKETAEKKKQARAEAARQEQQSKNQRETEKQRQQEAARQRLAEAQRQALEEERRQEEARKAAEREAKKQAAAEKQQAKPSQPKPKGAAAGQSKAAGAQGKGNAQASAAKGGQVINSKVVEPDSGQKWKPGDWLCPKCGHLCFAKVTNCFKCRTAKPAVCPGRLVARGELEVAYRWRGGTSAPDNLSLPFAVVPGQPLPGETPTQHLLREAYQANKEAQEKGNFVDVPEKQISACPLCQKSMRIEDIDHHIQFYCKAEEEKAAQKRKVQEETHRKAEQEAKRVRDLAERNRTEKARKAREEEVRKEREREAQAAAAAAAAAEAKERLTREQAQAEQRELAEQKRLAAEEERKRREARSHGPSALEIAMAKALEKEEQKRRTQAPKAGQDAANWELQARRQAEQAALEQRKLQEQRQREEEARRQQELADAQRKHCKFFLSKKGCRLGDACTNFHDTALLEQRAQLLPPVRPQPTQEDLDILGTVVSLLKAHSGEMRLNQLGSKLPPALKASKTLQKMKLKTFLLDYPELFTLPPSAPGFDSVLLVSQGQSQQPSQQPVPANSKSSASDHRETGPAAFASPSIAIPIASQSTVAPEPQAARQTQQLHFSTSTQIAERLFGNARGELCTLLANLTGCSVDDLAITIEPQADHSSTVTLLVPGPRAQWVLSTVEDHLARANGGLAIPVALRSPIGSPSYSTRPPGSSGSSPPRPGAVAPTTGPATPAGLPQLLRLQFTIEASVAEELFGDVNSVLRKTLANLASVLPTVLRVQLVPRGLLSHVTIWLPDTGNAWLAGAAVSMLEEALRRVAAITATITTDHVDAATVPSAPQGTANTTGPPSAPVPNLAAAAAATRPTPPVLFPAKPELEINQLPISLSSDDEDDAPLPAYASFSTRPGQWAPYEAPSEPTPAAPSSFFGPVPAAAPRWLPNPGVSEPWSSPQFGGFFSQPPHPVHSASPSFAPPYSLPLPRPTQHPAGPSPFFAPPPGPNQQPDNFHAPFGPGFLPGAGFFSGHSFYPPQEYPANHNPRPQPNGSGENRDETNNYGQFGSFYWNPVDQATRQ